MSDIRGIGESLMSVGLAMGPTRRPTLHSSSLIPSLSISPQEIWIDMGLRQWHQGTESSFFRISPLKTFLAGETFRGRWQKDRPCLLVFGWGKWEVVEEEDVLCLDWARTDRWSCIMNITCIDYAGNSFATISPKMLIWALGVIILSH